MKTILVGNLSEFENINQLSKKLDYMKESMRMALLGVESFPDKGLQDHLSHVQKMIVDAKDNLSVDGFKIHQDFLVTFCKKNKGSADTVHTVHTNSEWFSHSEFPIVAGLKALDIPVIAGVDIVVELNKATFDKVLEEIAQDVTVIKGSDISVRAKYRIKPVQPGKEALNDWSPLTEAVSIVITRVSSDVKSMEIKQLQAALEQSKFFTKDVSENIFLNV